MRLTSSRAEQILGIVFFVLGLVLCFLIIPWQIKDVGADFPTPRSFPTILSALLSLLGALLFVSGFLGRNKPDQKEYSISRVEARLVGITLGLMVVYVIALYYVPYIPATIVVLAALVFIYGQRNLIKLAGVSVGVPVAIYLIFSYVLKFNMP